MRHTYWLLGDSEHALKWGAGRFYFEAMVLASTGRTDEALAYLREMERAKRPELMQNFVGSLRLFLEGRYAESLAATEFCVRNFPDPEAVFYMARQLVQLGEPMRALEVLNIVLDRGFLLSQALGNDPWLASIQSWPEYGALLQRTLRLEEDAARAFTRMGGPELVG